MSFTPTSGSTNKSARVTNQAVATVNEGDCLVVGPEAGKIFVGSEDQGSEVEISGTTVTNKLIGSFANVYDPCGANTLITASETDGVITGYGTTFTSAMATGIVLWNNGLTSAINGYTDATHLSVQASPNGTTDKAKQHFKIYYNGIGFDASLGYPTLVLPRAASWTPELRFGGATTGITYTVRYGEYMQLGQWVFLTCQIVLSSKGSATGIATIGNLPVAFGANGAYQTWPCLTVGANTGSADLCSIFARGIADAQELTIWTGTPNSSSGDPAVEAEDSNFVITSQLSFNAMYLTT